MAFGVEVSHLAAARFRKLDPPVRDRVGAGLERAAEDPARHFKRLTGIAAYSLRVGDWRVICDIDWGEEIIYVLTVRHRKNAYE